MLFVTSKSSFGQQCWATYPNCAPQYQICNSTNCTVTIDLVEFVCKHANLQTTCTTVYAPLVLGAQVGGVSTCTAFYINNSNSCIECNFHLQVNIAGGPPAHFDISTIAPAPCPWICNGTTVFCDYSSNPISGGLFNIHY